MRTRSYQKNHRSISAK